MTILQSAEYIGIIAWLGEKLLKSDRKSAGMWKPAAQPPK
jgi:hypothetical protein